MTDAQYKAEHGLVLQGDQPLPEAFQTFESVGFPRDILDEVRPLRRSAAVPSTGAAGAAGRRLITYPREHGQQHSQRQLVTMLGASA